MSKGFIVKGEDTADFLRDKLEYMGLTPREYNEFIVFWFPEMQNKQYNLITFQDKVYTDNAGDLSIGGYCCDLSTHIYKWIGE